MADMLATPEDLATHMQQDVDTASATLALELATGAIQDALGWRILQETVTGRSILPLGPGGLLQLPTAYLTALALTEGGITLVDGRDYSWTPSGLVTRMGWGAPYVFPLASVVPWRAYPILATYTHGFVASSVPQAIRGVCIQVATRLFDNPTGLRSENVGQAAEVKTIGSTYAFAGPTLTDVEAKALTKWMVTPLVVVA
jgi:hypothetical protein